MARKIESKAVRFAKRRFVLLGLTSIVVIILTTFTIGNYWVDIYGKYKENKELDEKLYKLKDKEEELKVDVNKLNDPDYIGRYAREKYFYSKDGEFVIKIPEN